MNKKSIILNLALSIALLLCWTASSSAGLINYDRLNKRKGILAPVTLQGTVADINYRNREITVRNSNNTAEHKFIIDYDAVTGLSKGKMIEVSYSPGSNIAQTVRILQE